MLDTQVLERAEINPSYLSTFFLVPKTDGSFRPIFNLKRLNSFVHLKGFHLFSHFRMPSFLQSEDWMVKVDLSQAYFHLPIAKEHRRFLRLSYNGQLLQITCLPFGLSSAPRTFTSLTNWIAEYLRSRYIRCVVYLDNFMLVNQSSRVLREHIAFMVNLMRQLGWTINMDKSVLVPTQRLEFLGVTWDTKLNTKSLSEPKCLTLRRALLSQMSRGSWSLRQAQSLLGRLNFASFVIRRGRLHCRTLQFHSRHLPIEHPYKQVKLPEPVLSEMKWWLQAVQGSYTYRPDIVPAYDRCVGLRLGCSAGRHENVTGQWTRRQQSWHVNRKELFAVHAAIQQKNNQLRNAHIMLQESHGCSLYQQGRLNEVEETSEPDTRAVEGDGSFKHIHDGTVLPGAIQLRSRCPITWQGLSGMAPDAYSDAKHFRNMGHTTSRLIRVEDGPCGDDVCISGHTRSESIFSQRVPSSMELRTCLAIPSTKPNTTGSVSAEHGERSIYSDSSEVEDGILASRPTSSGHSRPLPNPEPATNFDRHENRNTPTRDSFGSLADFGWTNEIKDWSVEEKSLLSSWRKSTIATYIPAWNKWKTWCVSNNTSYKIPSPEQVARYLAYLHKSEGWAYRTILVHKSAITTFTNLSDSLSSNFFVKHILRAISVARVKEAKPPIWNTKSVLRYLENNAPDENNLYQVSRRTATLLLLAAGRRVHDLTLLRIDAEKYIDEGNAIVLWPCFGSKTDNINYRQTGWRLKEHLNKNLDCVHWTRQLIRTSQDRRRSGTLPELFITARGEPKLASRTVIGGWIKSVL